jgi:hypothetical protein
VAHVCIKHPSNSSQLSDEGWMLVRCSDDDAGLPQAGWKDGVRTRVVVRLHCIARSQHFYSRSTSASVAASCCSAPD